MGRLAGLVTLLALAGTVALAAPAFAAQGDKPEALQTPMEQVAALEKEGKLVEAAELLRALAAQSKEPWLLDHRAALLLQRAGRLDEARAMHSQLARSDNPPLTHRQVASMWVYTLEWRNELAAIADGGGMALAAEMQAGKALAEQTVITHRGIKKVLARMKSTRMALERTRDTLVKLVGADDTTVSQISGLLAEYDAHTDNSRWLLNAAKQARALQKGHDSAVKKWSKAVGKVGKALAKVDAEVRKGGAGAKGATKARKAVEGKALGVADALQTGARGASESGRELAALLAAADQRLKDLRAVVEIAEMMLAPAK